MHLYLGTYTSGDSEGIYRCDFSSDTGQLGQPRLVARCTNPSFLALHPTRPLLYAALEVDDLPDNSGGVAAFAIDPDAGTLRPLNQQPTGGAGTCHVSLDPAGRYVLAANFSDGNIAAFGLADDGSLKAGPFTHQHEGSGPHPRRQRGPHAHCTVPSPDGRFALSADLGIDEVYVYRLAEEGVRLHDSPTFVVTAGSGPRHLCFSPEGRYVYVISEMGNILSVFAWNATAGTAEPVEVLSTLPEGHRDESHTAEVAMHPSGRFVYGSNRGHHSIAVFARDDETGRLTPRGHTGTRGDWPRHFAIDPSGRWLVCANEKSDNILCFAVCPESGELAYVEGSEINLDKPVCVRFA